MYGPSGSGKTTLARKLCRNYSFKHCDTDYFMLAFSKKRSSERSLIAVEVCTVYAKELIKRNHNIIIESITSKRVNALKRLLTQRGYRIIEISLVASLDHCLKNNRTRHERKFSKSAIQDSHKRHSVKKGTVIEVSSLSAQAVYARAVAALH